MSFLKLTSRIINVSHIKNVIINEEKYIINLVGDTSGFFLVGSGFFGDRDHCIVVEKDSHLKDYENVSKCI